MTATKNEDRGEMKKVLEECPDFKYEKISNRHLPIIIYMLSKYNCECMIHNSLLQVQYTKST